MSTDKKNMIFISGWAMPSFIFEPLAAQFTNYKIQLLDLPGVHHNQRVAAPSIAAYAENLVQHIPDRSIVIGWSLGGMVASYIALHYPEKIKILIQLTSSPYFLKSAHAEDCWPGLRPKHLALLEHNVLTNFNCAITDFIQLQFHGLKTVAHKHQLSTLKHIDWNKLIHSTQALQHGIQLLRNTDLRQQLQDMNIPCLYILGRLDAIVPEKISHHLPSLNQRIDVIILPHASHMPFLTHTTECANHIQEYLNKAHQS